MFCANRNVNFRIELEEQIGIEVVELDDKSGYAFDYDVPLNGA